MRKASAAVYDKTTLPDFLAQREKENSQSREQFPAASGGIKEAAGFGTVLPSPSSLNAHLRQRSQTPKLDNPSGRPLDFDTKYELFPSSWHQPRRHMYMKASDRAAAIDARIERLAQKWTASAQPVAYSQLAHPGQIHEEPVITVGRIVSDSDAAMNSSSMLLESSRAIGNGARVPLDISHLQLQQQQRPSHRPLCFFPGQIVMLEGTNPDGKTFKVTKLHQPSGWLMQIPRPLAGYADYNKFHDNVLSIAVATGPYSQLTAPAASSLDYSPLDRLLNTTILPYQPECLVLFGPFVDSRQCHSALIELPDQIFVNEVATRLKTFMAASPKTRIILLPSLQEAVQSFPVFPQPTTQLPGLAGTNVKFASNPAIFCINEVIFAAGNDNILGSIAKEAVTLSSNTAKQDAAAAMASIILQQGSFYPLLPAHTGANVDFGMLELLELQFAPDILLAPSPTLPAFARTVPEDNCVVVNPSSFCGDGDRSENKVTLISINAPQMDAAKSDRIASRVRVDFF